MIDIDFRYVEREALDYCREPPACTEKVLQWRKKVYMPVPNQPDLPVGAPPLLKLEPEWTEWQDVRTEEE